MRNRVIAILTVTVAVVLGIVKTFKERTYRSEIKDVRSELYGDQQAAVPTSQHKPQVNAATTVTPFYTYNFDKARVEGYNPRLENFE